MKRLFGLEHTHQDPPNGGEKKSSRIAEIDAIRLAEFEAEFKSRRRRSRVRDVFGNTHNVE